MLAMRGYMRAKSIEGVHNEAIATDVGLTGAQIEEMYKVMAQADYEDRFVIPTGHSEDAEDMIEERGSYGFSFGNVCSSGARTEEHKTESQSPNRRSYSLFRLNKK